MTEKSMQAVLSLQQVSLHYGGFLALDQISLDVMQGERIGIVGANGAGKSSLFDLLSGFYKPSAGDIYLHGIRLNRLSQEKRCRLGIARSFQRSRLFEKMTVLENLQCTAFMRYASFWQHHAFWGNMANIKKMRPQIDQIAQDMGLFKLLHERAGMLSCAAQRLLELGMLLATDAQILLLDEPTAGLSIEEADLFLVQLNSHMQGKTVLFIEHDMKVVRQFADRVLVLWQGQMLACDAPDVIFNDEDVMAHW